MTDSWRPTIAGRDIADDLMGKVDFVSVVALRLTGALPSPHQHALLNALLVMLVEHGMTPSAIATRMTQLSEPHALAPAVASGLLGAGSRFLGTPRVVAEDLREQWERADSPAAVAIGIVTKYADLGLRVPGFGHPVHSDGDPRVPVIERLAADNPEGCRSSVVMREVERLLTERRGRLVPLNAAGAMGAAIHDAGYPPQIAAAVALVARACGLVGHFFDEQQQPIAPGIWEMVREKYDG